MKKTPLHTMNIDLKEQFKSDFVPLLALFIFRGMFDTSIEFPIIPHL